MQIGSTYLLVEKMLTYLTWASKAGVRGGHGGTRPPQSKNQRVTSPEIIIFQYLFFLDTYDHFAFSTIFKIKWPKSEEKLNFGGR